MPFNQYITYRTDFRLWLQKEKLNFFYICSAHVQKTREPLRYDIDFIFALCKRINWKLINAFCTFFYTNLERMHPNTFKATISSRFSARLQHLHTLWKDKLWQCETFDLVFLRKKPNTLFLFFLIWVFSKHWLSCVPLNYLSKTPLENSVCSLVNRLWVSFLSVYTY